LGRGTYTALAYPLPGRTAPTITVERRIDDVTPSRDPRQIGGQTRQSRPLRTGQTRISWSGWRDLNPWPLDPQSRRDPDPRRRPNPHLPPPPTRGHRPQRGLLV